MNPSAFTQQAGTQQQQWGQGTPQQSYAPNAFGASPSPYSSSNGASNPNLVAQQLAQQQQSMGQQGSPGAASQLAQQQAYLQARQQAGGMGGAPSTPAAGQQYGSMGFQGQQQQNGALPAYPPQQSSAEASQQALRSMGIDIRGMTPERFSSLPPAQQAVLRQVFMQQKQQQQHALGLGMPGSPAGSAGPGGAGSPTMNGASPMGAGAGQTPGGQGGFGQVRPPSQGPAPSAPQSGQQPSQQQQQQQTPQGPQAANFVKTLTDFYAKRGQPFPGVPTIDGRQVDLSAVYQREQSRSRCLNVADNPLLQSSFELVASRRSVSPLRRVAGSADLLLPQVHQLNMWRQILTAIGFPVDPSTGQQPDARIHQLAQVCPFAPVSRAELN